MQPQIKMLFRIVSFILALSTFNVYADASADYLILYRGGGKGSMYLPGFHKYDATQYWPSDKNIEFLKTLKPKLLPVKIAGFGSANAGKKSLICRASYPVSPPEGISFEAFLAEALRAELLRGEMYSDENGTPIIGFLNSLDFSSFGTGSWKIDVTFSAPGKEPVNVKREFNYSISMGAVNACKDVERALLPALQDFFYALYSNPEFQALLQRQGESTASPPL